MADPDSKTQPSSRHNGHLVLALTFVMTIVFVFGSAAMVMGIAAWSCYAGNSCGQLDGLSHVVMAWTGAVIGGALGHLLGSTGRNIL